MLKWNDNNSRDGFGFLAENKPGEFTISVPNDWVLVDIQSDAEALEFVEESGADFTPCGRRVMAPCADREAHAKLADMLLTEAVAARQSSVPPGALVEFSFGDFKSVEISEKRDTVYFAWRDDKGIPRFVCRIKVSGEKFEWEIVTDGLAATRDRIRSGPSDIFESDIKALWWAEAFDNQEFAALYFLSAAILRDFWVVEDRSSAFRLGLPRVRRTSDRFGKKVDRIIYLPRCRYSHEKTSAAALAETKIWSVSPHFIRSHFRMLGDGHRASIKQRAIASLHGVTEMPEGKTWVRAHVAGMAAEGGLTRYRSRTASRSLFDVVDLSKQVSLLDGISWFDFERLCEKMMQGRGYMVVDKVGDGGIDILAVNSSGKFALGQAKHWAEKVGPSVVREMIGTRSKFEADHGVTPIAIILSSSGFTYSAKSDAAAANIELVDVRSDAR